MRPIDADAVVTIQTYDDMYEEWGTETMAVAKAMDKFSDEGCPPTIDAVEVVRCRDCKENPTYIRAKGMVWCRKFRTDVHRNGFCSYGERKEQKENV